MTDKKQKNSALPAKNTGKAALKSAKQRVESETKEIKRKVKEKQQKVKNAITGKKQQNGKNAVASNRLKLLVTIVARNKAEYYLDLIQSFDVNMQCVLIGQGTANESMLGLLGLTDSDKAVILSVIQENKVPDALSTLEVKFDQIKGGKGVACTLPLTSVIGALIYRFLSNNRDTVKENNNGKQ
ncbi:MAG: hypothetical protein K2M64_01080 [Clostridia bacterium]|nr:hypothetical protein [Clostridia bacterium]